MNRNIYEWHSFNYRKKQFSDQILNVYIGWDYWLRNPLNNSTPKNCLFSSTYIVKNKNKSKYVYSDYGKAFKGAESWRFGNDVTRNIRNFGADYSIASHT